LTGWLLPSLKPRCFAVSRWRHFGWCGDFFACYKATKEQAAEGEPMRPIPIQTWIKAIRFATK